MGILSLFSGRKTAFNGPKYFALSIDVENDMANTGRWESRIPYCFENLLEGLPKILQPLFEKYGARPTYLLNPSVVMDEACVAMFRGFKNCELGTHLHPEFFDPANESEEVRAKYYPGPSPIMLDGDQAFELLKKLTELFTSRFGYPPRSYRGSRYGFNGEHAEYIRRLGYKVDTSVVPRRWDVLGNRFVCNYERWRSNEPVFIRNGKADEELLEIPVSVDRRGRQLRMRPDKKLKRIMKIVHDVELSGAGWDSGILVANMMFHSNDVYPEGSPRCQSPEEHRIVMRQLEQILSHAKREGYEFVTLSELHSRLAEIRDRIACRTWDEASGLSEYERALERIVAREDFHPFFLRARNKVKRTALKMTMRHVERRDVRILDCGCGLLNFVFMLGEEGFRDFLALDYSEDYCKAGEELAKTFDFPVEIRQADGNKISAESYGKFGLVIHLNWTYEAPGLDYADLLRRTREMLEPPACLLIDTIDYPHPWLWDDRDLPESERRRTQYVNTVKPDEFRRLAESSGLRVLEQKDVGNFKTLFLLQVPLL